MEDQEPSVAKLYFQVIAKYQLPVLNHTILKSKIRALETEIGAKHARYYLQALLRRDYAHEAGEFKPALSNGLDLYGKRLKIEDWLRKNKPPAAWQPPTDAELAAQEAERLKQFED